MKIAVSEISADKRALRFGEREDWSKVFAERHGLPDFKFARLPDVNVEFYRVGDEIMIAGTIEAAVAADCVRCLKSFELEVDVSFRYHLLPKETEQGLPAELEFGAEEAEVDYYDSDSIDFNPMVSEQILLEIPAGPKCSDACEGICPKCGADLNSQPCGCDKEEKLSPFSALKDFKVKGPNG